MYMPAIAFGGELQMWAYLSGKTALLKPCCAP